MWSLNSMLVNSQWANEEIKKKIWKVPNLRQMKMERQYAKIYGYQQRQF